MAFQTAAFLGSQGFSAQRDRQLMEFMRSEGVLRKDDCKVSQRGAGANWSIDISAGWIFTQGDTIAFQGLYNGYNDAIINKAFTTLAPATNPRVDSIVARIFDQEAGEVATGGKPQDQLFIDIIPGTETSGATVNNIVGQATLPPTATLLAYAVIPTAAVSVLDAYIKDMRVISNPKIYGEDGYTYRLGIDSLGQLGTELI